MPNVMASNSIANIAFGGNIGDVTASFRSARNAVAQLANTSVNKSSLCYLTPPIGPAGQADYYNAVIAITTALTPLALLDSLQNIETQHQRMRTQHWGPRTLDLDIISIDNQSINNKRLNIPHPHMQDRQFVLRPLCDIAPNWQHPVLKKSATQLLQALLESGEPALPKGIRW